MAEHQATLVALRSLKDSWVAMEQATADQTMIMQTFLSISSDFIQVGQLFDGDEPSGDKLREILQRVLDAVQLHEKLGQGLTVAKGKLVEAATSLNTAAQRGMPL